jgi:hypothetical protein
MGSPSEAKLGAERRPAASFAEVMVEVWDANHIA